MPTKFFLKEVTATQAEHHWLQGRMPALRTHSYEKHLRGAHDQNRHLGKVRKDAHMHTYGNV